MILLITWAPVAHAGGPFGVDTVKATGQPMRWQNNTFEWYVDDGPLSTDVDSETARQWVKEQFDKWMSITLTGSENKPLSSTVIRASFKGSIGTDIDDTNYFDFDREEEPRTIVVFDEGGKIASSLGFNNTPGLTALRLMDSSGLYITKGISILNGAMLGERKLTHEQFKAVIFHEMGHLLNLDHTQVNLDIATSCELNKDCENGNYIPTMYPDLKTETMGIPAYDDIITLSWIYPSSDFEKSFCAITGELFDAKGKPLKGINVLGLRAGEGDVAARVDARSFVSGALKAGCAGDAKYYLYGIIPGHAYQIVYEPLGDFRGASAIQPLVEYSPKGFNRGTILTTSGDSTVTCDSGGQTIEMASQTIDITNPCVQLSGGDVTDNSEQKAASSSKCSLLPLGGFSYLPVLFLAMAIVMVGMRKNSA